MRHLTAAWRRTAASAPLVDSFRAAYADDVQQVQDPAKARGLCEWVNGMYVQHMRDAGQQADLVDVARGDYPHTVAEVGEMIVDWTARQLDPAAAIPTVTSKPEFYREWRYLQEHDL